MSTKIKLRVKARPVPAVSANPAKHPNETETPSPATKGASASESCELESWLDAYEIFLDVAEEILNQCENHEVAHQNIQTKVDEIYFQHQGEWIWDFAYARWHEQADDGEEVY